MSGNGARPGETQAVFGERDAVFAAFDSLEPEVRSALHDAPVPYSPIQVRDYGRQSGTRGAALAAVVKRMGQSVLDAADARIREALNGRRVLR